MTRSITRHFLALAACAALAQAGAAGAAEGFEPRYNLAGSLGGELFAPPDQSGWATVLAATRIRIDRITGDDGQKFTQMVPGGAVPLPSVPAPLLPAYGANRATVDGTGVLTRWDLVTAYLTPEQYGGGRLAFAIDVPFARKQQSIVVNAATPALSWSPALPAAMQAPVQGQFDAQYQAGLAAQGGAATDTVSGIGDIELQAGWLYVGEKIRILADTALILPTGKYDAGPGPDIGAGKFTTLRPGIQVGYLPTPEIAFAGKLSLGLNSRNRDNHLRSGNWAALEVAAGYKTPIGIVGVHALHMHQYQDDDNNPFGTSRFRSTNTGVFFTTKIIPIDTIVTIQYIGTKASRNAKDGTFTQLRLIKLW